MRKADEELETALAWLEDNDFDELMQCWKNASARTRNHLRSHIRDYCDTMTAENCDDRVACIPFATNIGIYSEERGAALLKAVLSMSTNVATHAQAIVILYEDKPAPPLSLLVATYNLEKDQRRPSQTGFYRDQIPEDAGEREQFLQFLASKGALVVLAAIFGGTAKIPECYIEKCRDNYESEGHYYYQDFVVVVIRLKNWELAREALPDMLENSADCAGNLLLAMYKAGERNFAFVESETEPVSPSETPPPVPFLVVDAQSPATGEPPTGSTELPKADPQPTT
jgi:hypothetical protein